MKVALDIINLSKLKKPTKDDIIIYNGKEWYITTKNDILKETNDLLEEIKENLLELKKENNSFKQQVSKDIIEITNTTKTLLKLKGDNL